MAEQTIIKNYEQLLLQGDEKARQMVLKAAEHALRSLNSYAVLKRSLKMADSRLCFGSNQWDLSAKKNIYVIGGGKAANAMARAVEDVLGDRITAGIVAVKRLEPGDQLKKIELLPAGHPLPNLDSLRASRRMLELVEQATPDDLFIGLISGGSSALLSLPVAGISLEDEIACTHELLASGARILEINAVRRHISAINGGRLAQAIEQRGAETINFIISDGVGNAPPTDPLKPARFCGTPVAPDNTTFADAAEVLNKYDLRDKIPQAIVEYVDKADPCQETPKSFSGRICHFVIQRVADGAVAALEAAKSQGLRAFILTTVLQGESREAGTFLACVAREVATTRRPFTPPCLLIACGETTTAMDGQSGLGGPSQELALGFALEIAEHPGICLGAIDTDGTDGPTDLAGGLVDGATMGRAARQGINLFHCLKDHDSLRAFKALGDGIETGNTGTNVCDLNIISVL